MTNPVINKGIIEEYVDSKSMIKQLETKAIPYWTGPKLGLDDVEGPMGTYTPRWGVSLPFTRLFRVFDKLGVPAPVTVYSPDYSSSTQGQFTAPAESPVTVTPGYTTGGYYDSVYHPIRWDDVPGDPPWKVWQLTDPTFAPGVTIGNGELEFRPDGGLYVLTRIADTVAAGANGTESGYGPYNPQPVVSINYFQWPARQGWS